jgi:hypothetical protein
MVNYPMSDIDKYVCPSFDKILDKFKKYGIAPKNEDIIRLQLLKEFPKIIKEKSEKKKRKHDDKIKKEKSVCMF